MLLKICSKENGITYKLDKFPQTSVIINIDLICFCELPRAFDVLYILCQMVLVNKSGLYCNTLQIYAQNSTVVKAPNSYYVFTTFDGINLPRFASICLFRYIFHNLNKNGKPRKSCQNTANQSISGGIIIMISILFVYHGNTRTQQNLKGAGQL